MSEIVFLSIWAVIGLIVGIWWFVDNWKWKKAHSYYNDGVTLGDVFLALFAIIGWPVHILFMSDSFVIKKFK
mgnify:CR=1 FL=1